ncbi:MAG TPA: acetate--CoA ligase family protein [Syntrophorhabdaceae bacterium]|nr:acetate--CoA ligase family protein [Syntrophorhabdaceae bacterium]
MEDKNMDMDRFFNPKSIVVFGVSETTTNLGRIITGNLERFNFRGNIYSIGPSEGFDGERRIFTNINSIEETPDLAVILVPAPKVPGVLEECGKKGITHAIIETGGFSEFSSERNNLEKQIQDIRERYRMNIIGPNCFGVVNIDKGVVLPFFILSPHYMKPGRVSLISQSGGIFYDTCMISSCENLGLAKVISIGNKLATDENACLKYLIHDPETDAIGIYLEHFSDGKRFLEIVSSTEKPIVLLKANRGHTSREIAQFHTAALAGDDEVAEVAMKQAGVILVKGFHEMVDCLKVFCLEKIKGDRLAVISRSGGHSVLAADSVERYGFRLARYSQRLLNFVKSKKLNVIRATNPLDVGDVYDLSLYTHILKVAIKENNVDGVIFIVTYSSETDSIKVKEFIKDAEQISRAFKKPVALSVITNKDEWFSTRDSAQIPIFSDCDRAIWAMARYLEHTKGLSNRERLSKKRSYPVERSTTIKKTGFGMIHPAYAFQLLKDYGLPVAEQGIIKNLEEAKFYISSMGYPVVLKNASPHILHKTEKKGVILNINNEDELYKAMGDINAEEYIIQPMYKPGIEIIIGVKNDKDFGHVALVGLGGLYTEILKDRSMRILPLDEDEVEEMLKELKAYKIIQGFRGIPPSDINSIKSIIVGVSRLIIENPHIEELDINPAIIYKENEGAIIVDAKIRFS